MNRPVNEALNERERMQAERSGGTGSGGFAFPGRWIGGLALVAGPLLLLGGVLLRMRFHFFFPDQLAAVEAHPALMTASYSLFAAGNVTLVPAVLALAGKIGVRCPAWALWGGLFAVLGLLARTFHAGVDHLAFRIAVQRGADAAIPLVADAYGAFHIFSTFNAAIMLGWVVLAYGAYRSGSLGLPGSLALVLTAALPLGVLKGTTPLSIVAAAGLCLALVPLGVKMLREGPMPSLRAMLVWTIGTGVAGYVFFFIGRQG